MDLDIDQIDVNYSCQVECTLSYRQFKDNHEIALVLDIQNNDLVVDKLKDVFKREFRIAAPRELIDITASTQYGKTPIKTTYDVLRNIRQPIRVYDSPEAHPTLRLRCTVREPIWKEGQGYWLNQEDYDEYMKRERQRRETNRLRMQRDAQIMEEQMDLRETIDKQEKEIQKLREEMKEMREMVMGMSGRSSRGSMVRFDEMEISEAVQEMLEIKDW